MNYLKKSMFYRFKNEAQYDFMEKSFSKKLLKKKDFKL